MKELEIAAQEELMHNYSSSTVIISTYGESARIEKCESFFFSQEAMINMFRKGAEWQAKQSIEILSSVLEKWVHGGDADCFIAEFEEKLNNK